MGAHHGSSMRPTICWAIKRELFQKLSFDAMSASFLTARVGGGIRFLRGDSRRPMAPCPFGSNSGGIRDDPPTTRRETQRAVVGTSGCLPSWGLRTARGQVRHGWRRNVSGDAAGAITPLGRCRRPSRSSRIVVADALSHYFYRPIGCLRRRGRSFSAASQRWHRPASAGRRQSIIC